MIDTRYDAIVLGGGMASLGAAERLQAAQLALERTTR
jgi:succinate dehydrogenase/fumarate reductase flavoprotein subunit